MPARSQRQERGGSGAEHRRAEAEPQPRRRHQPKRQRGALDELQRREHRGGHQQRVAGVAHVHVGDQPGGQGRADRVRDQADEPLGFEGAERHGDDHPSVPCVG